MREEEQYWTDMSKVHKFLVTHAGKSLVFANLETIVDNLMKITSSQRVSFHLMKQPLDTPDVIITGQCPEICTLYQSYFEAVLVMRDIVKEREENDRQLRFEYLVFVLNVRV